MAALQNKLQKKKFIAVILRFGRGKDVLIVRKRLELNNKRHESQMSQPSINLHTVSHSSVLNQKMLFPCETGMINLPSIMSLFPVGMLAKVQKSFNKKDKKRILCGEANQRWPVSLPSSMKALLLCQPLINYWPGHKQKLRNSRQKAETKG